MSRRATSIRRPGSRSWHCSRNSRRRATPSSLSPTKSPWPVTRGGSSAFWTGGSRATNPRRATDAPAHWTMCPRSGPSATRSAMHQVLRDFSELSGRIPLHAPCSSGRESAHSSLEKCEPTHVGCYESEPVHGPNAFEKRKGVLHEPTHPGPLPDGEPAFLHVLTVP